MKMIKVLSIAIVSILLTVSLVGFFQINISAGAPPERQSVQAEAFSAADGYLLRFDTAITQFTVITLPVVPEKPRQPESVVAVGNDIWYTDPGADRIGQLVYTDSTQYAFFEIQLPGGSAPFDMVADGGYLWFTAKSGDWIGRLELSTANVISFPVMADSEPWRIDVGADGSVWFTERAANKLGHLVVTDTTDYALAEYYIPDNNSNPEGIAIETKIGTDLVWFGETAPANSTKVVRFNPNKLPPDNFASLGVLSGAGYPNNIRIAAGHLWATERLGNNLSLIDFATNSSAVQYPVPTNDSQPFNLALKNDGDEVWFTEQVGHQIGKLYRDLKGFHFLEYQIPASVSTIWLRGITTRNTDEIWVSGFEPLSVYLPLIER